MQNQIIIIGDIHGDFKVISDKLERGVISDSTLIQIGDFGLGFNEAQVEDARLIDLSEALDKSNCDLLIIRGNHDCPDIWFENRYVGLYKRIKLIQDYTSLDINGERFLFVGGAISIDRIWRERGASYWPNEAVSPVPDDLPQCDVLIAHTCPSYCNVSAKGGNFMINAATMDGDVNLVDDLIHERELLDEIVYKSGVSRVYSGHFHNSTSQTVHGIKYRCVNIDEFLEHKPNN